MEEVLEVWETGRDQHPLDRALTLLLAAHPGASRASLASLSLAERDRRLLELRARMVGPAVAAFTLCPACGERLEMEFQTGDLLAGLPAPSAGPWERREGALRLVFRLPDSRDLAAAAGCGDEARGRRLLAARCVLEAWRGEEPVPPSSLSDGEIAVLGGWMTECAPDAEFLLELGCPGCGHGWGAVFEVGAFLWTELSVRAKRVLREVDALARAYGWSEREILGLPPRRRRSYLELVEG